MQQTEKDKPHRVIYHQKSRTFTRIFGNYAKALEFANTVNGTIQPATESIDSPGRRCFGVNQNGKANKNKCVCGRAKLTSDEQCTACRVGSVVLGFIENQQKGYAS